MALSEHEQRLLDQLEKQLNAEDPVFASSMSSHKVVPPRPKTVGARNIVIGILIALVGLSIILLGVNFKLIIVGVAGFIVALAGFYVAFTPARRPATQETHHVTASAQKQSSFMRGLEDKWDERRFGGR